MCLNYICDTGPLQKSNFLANVYLGYFFLIAEACVFDQFVHEKTLLKLLPTIRYSQSVQKKIKSKPVAIQIPLRLYSFAPFIVRYINISICRSMCLNFNILVIATLKT